LDCCNKDKTCVYLERSMSLPVNLSLHTDYLSLHTDYLSPPKHTFFDIIQHAIGRLGSLIIDATPENLQDITNHLSRPASLLEKLSVCGDPNDEPDRIPVLTPALFDGDLSSSVNGSFTYSDLFHLFHLFHLIIFGNETLSTARK
jgi:hypothetical protein